MRAIVAFAPGKSPRGRGDSFFYELAQEYRLRLKQTLINDNDEDLLQELYAAISAAKEVAEASVSETPEVTPVTAAAEAPFSPYVPVSITLNFLPAQTAEGGPYLRLGTLTLYAKRSKKRISKQNLVKAHAIQRLTLLRAGQATADSPEEKRRLALVEPLYELRAAGAEDPTHPRHRE